MSNIKTMKKDKQFKMRVISIPNDFNRLLKMRVLELDEIGVKTTVSELIIKYAQIGFNVEKM